MKGSTWKIQTTPSHYLFVFLLFISIKSVQLSRIRSFVFFLCMTNMPLNFPYKKWGFSSCNKKLAASNIDFDISKIVDFAQVFGIFRWSTKYDVTFFGWIINICPCTQWLCYKSSYLSLSCVVFSLKATPWADLKK